MRAGARAWVVAATVAGAAWLAACAPDGGESAGDGATATEEAVYVDVRTPQEFASGHVAGAINIPHTEMPRRWTELEEYRDQPMVVYCRTGRRSGIALDVLREHGFDQARNGGGLQDLVRRGVPTTR